MCTLHMCIGIGKKEHIHGLDKTQDCILKLELNDLKVRFQKQHYFKHVLIKWVKMFSGDTQNMLLATIV